MQLFCITAVRFNDGQLEGVMLGLADGSTNKWVSPPVETPIDAVVAHLDRGNRVQTLFPDGAGGYVTGPEVRTVIVAGNRESIAMLGGPVQGKAFGDMPTF